MKYFKRLTSTGDTIIEVLIVLAILGLALSISYATATKGLNQSRNAEEHSEALGIINSQVEALRSAYANKKITAPPANSFCFLPDLTLKTMATNVWPNNNAGDPAYGTTGCGGQQTFYDVSVTSQPSGPLQYYDFLVRWDGIGSLGRQQEELSYRIDQQSIATNGLPEAVTAPTPPGPPPLTNLDILGASFSNCVPAEPVFNDGYDGCKTDNAGNMYAYRDITVTYPPVSGLKPGPGTLTVWYHQYSSGPGSSTPPPGYQWFHFQGTVGTQPFNIQLRVSSGNTSFTPASQSFPVTVDPAGNLPTMTATWDNNAGIDPNLQIDKLTFTSP